MKDRFKNSLLSLEPIRAGKVWPTYDKGNVIIGTEECDAALKVIKEKRLFRYDNRPFLSTETGQFEQEVARKLGSTYCLATSSGTAAMTLALLASGVKEGDEVLCSAFGFPATPSAVILAGAKPVLVEVDEHLHIDEKDIERKISRKTKALIMVHMRGQVGNINIVREICRKHSIVFVEDAVPVLGLTIQGKYVGTFGDVGVFSTQSDKSLNTGEGGFLVTDNRDIFERAIVFSGAYEHRARKHFKDGVVNIDELTFPLFNFRMDEVRASIARVQLKKLDSRVNILQRNYSLFSEILTKYQEILVRRPYHPDGSLGDALVFRLPSFSDQEIEDFVNLLKKEGIEARRFLDRGNLNVRAFWTWKFMFKNLSDVNIMALLPNSAKYLKSSVDIPLSAMLTYDDKQDFEKIMERIFS